MRKSFVFFSVVIMTLILVWAYFQREALFAFVLVGPLVYMGFADMIQTKQSIKRNFPLLGRLRYVLEDFRP